MLKKTNRSRWTALGMMTLALAATIGTTALAQQSQPRRGSTMGLSSRFLYLNDDVTESLELFRDSLSDLNRLFNDFRPALPRGARMHEQSFRGEATRAQLEFRSTVRVSCEMPVFGGQIETDMTQTLRAAITRRALGDHRRMNPGLMPDGSSCLGYEIRLDLTRSDEHIRNQADAFIARVCLDPAHGNRTRVRLRTLMVVGPDYGMRCAGAFARSLLASQTDPLVAVLMENIPGLARQ